MNGIALGSDRSSTRPDALTARLTDPALAAALTRFVGARVPRSEVQDIVQSALAAALDADSETAPVEDEDIVRWVHGICRHKMVDWFRRSRREVPHDLEAPDQPALSGVAAESAPQSAMDLLRWAQKELPAGEENAKTLEWMLREGAGEKLETIAAEANLPAPRVRQRVSRLRRYYKARWAAQAAALAALLLVALALALALRQRKEEVAPAPVPSLLPSPVPTAPELPPLELPAMSSQPEAPPAPAPSAAPSSSGSKVQSTPSVPSIPTTPTTLTTPTTPTAMRSTPPGPTPTSAPAKMAPAKKAKPMSKSGDFGSDSIGTGSPFDARKPEPAPK